MKRKALIVYCDNTNSGRLPGPVSDFNNYFNYLYSQLGGDWSEDEILSLRNPTIAEVNYAVAYDMMFCDYTFIIFSGHGYIQRGYPDIQYVELSDGNLPISSFRTDSTRQTLIVDACRGYYTNTVYEELEKAEKSFNFIGSPSTRAMFNNAVMACNTGQVVMFAASENQSALDTPNGGAYLSSLLATANGWKRTDRTYRILPLISVHQRASIYMSSNFETTQTPQILPPRNNYFPFAVKH